MSAVLLLPLFVAAFFSQNAIEHENEFGTKISTTSYIRRDVVDDNEILSMIERQSALCPYVRLCTHANRSTSMFIANKTGEFPCCSECSCQPSCTAEGSCCPDFYYENIMENVSSKEEETENTTHSLKCVKVNHGLLYRHVDGYKIIASCKSSFTGYTVKHLCENTPYERIRYSLVDIFPVIHKEDDLSYKNIFCYLCNRDDTQSYAVLFQSVSFWDSYLHCSGQLVSSRNIELDPLYFGKTLLQRSCSIEFKSSLDSESNLEACKVNDVGIIESCLVEHADTKLESLCRLYSWPIKNKSTGYYSTYESFKNLACLLCNDRIVSNTCFEVSPKKPTYTVLLTKADPSIVTISLKNSTEGAYSGNQIFLNRTIYKYFPDSKGNILCEKGFIFDDEKNKCRQVFCPNYSFLNNGSCSPIFNQSKGLYYFHPFKVIFPTSLYGVDTDELEGLIFSRLNQRLFKHLGNISYDLSLWCSTNVRAKMSMARNYVVSIIIGNEFKFVRYVDVLGVFHWITRRNVLADITENPQNVYEEVQFQFSSRYTHMFSKIKDISGETLYLRRIRTNKTFKDYGDKMFEISASHLCYRVQLNFSEIKGKTLPNAIRVGQPDTLLVVPNFQILRTGNDMTFMVCLEHVLSGISEASKNIFHTIEQTNKPGFNRGDNHAHSNWVNAILTESTASQIEKSVGITIATAVLALVIVAIRTFLKKLRRRSVER